MPSESFQQEWLTGNQETQFPFRDSCGAANDPVPTDLLVDFRLFLSQSLELEVYLASLQYSSTPDTYTLVFAKIADNTAVLTGTIARKQGDQSSRVFHGQTLVDGRKVALFTPGPLWDNPAWNGSGDWTKQWTAQAGALETSLVNPGPKTFLGIMIDGTPVPTEWGLGRTQTLKAGYNIEFGSGRTRVPVLRLNGAPNDILDLRAAGGAGEGYVPAGTPMIDYVATFKGAGPDRFGNVNWQGEDCLRVSRPELNGAPIPHHIQVTSDCQPCCPCDDYQHASTAITRRSRKISDLCQDLAKLLTDEITAYNTAVTAVNATRT